MARPSSEGRPLYELVVPRRPIYDDLSAVPADAEFLATRGSARSLSRLAELEHLTAVWANPATESLFEACARASGLRALYVTNFKRLDRVKLAGATTLEHLMLNWATRLVDLSFLRRISSRWPNVRVSHRRCHTRREMR